MARRGGLERAITGTAKAIYKAHKQAVKEEERRKKAAAREKARLARERDKLLKEKLRRPKASEKAAIKREIENAKTSFETRCKERGKLRTTFINLELK